MEPRDSGGLSLPVVSVLGVRRKRTVFNRLEHGSANAPTRDAARYRRIGRPGEWTADPVDASGGASFVIRSPAGDSCASSERVALALGALRWTASHEPLRFSGVASVMTSTASANAASLPGPHVIWSASPSRVRRTSSPLPPSSVSPVDVAGAADVGAGERPEHVVAVAAEGDVGAAVGVDRVVAGAAVLAVVAVAAGHAVVAVLAEGHVVARAAVDAVGRVAALEGVVARGAEDAIERGEVAVGVDVARDRVVARAAVEPVVAGHAADDVVAGVAEDAIVARTAVEGVVSAEPADAVVAAVALDRVGGARAAQQLAAGAALDRRRERGGGDDQAGCGDRSGESRPREVHVSSSRGWSWTHCAPREQRCVGGSHGHLTPGEKSMRARAPTAFARAACVILCPVHRRLADLRALVRPPGERARPRSPRRRRARAAPISSSERRRPTRSTAVAATTRCSAAPATTSSTAAPAATCSPATPAATR